MLFYIMDKYSFLNTIHPSQLNELYNDYLINPDQVEPSWRAFFQGFDFGKEESITVVESNGQESTTQQTQQEVPEDVRKEFQVINLINGYRQRGHLFTKTNPVRERRNYEPKLHKENFGLQDEDLEKEFEAGELLGIGKASLKKIIKFLKNVFCYSIGVEYAYIRKPEKVEWIQDFIYKNENQPQFDEAEKKHILRKLNEAVSFESFLHKQYVGQKRFSLEGGESLIPALDALIENAADNGVEDFVLGMAHRGRLNTLANIFGKNTKEIFNEFAGKEYETDGFDGDVKYHLGWSSKRKTDKDKTINLNLAPNPSHLEAVGGIVEGITRAKLEDHHDGNEASVLPIIIHGDAAISAQGTVYEVVQMAKLDGFRTGGTIHIVVNNQIGFTTNYLDGRSSTYCTDVGKVTLSPVLHVNADDAEAVVHAINFALAYRMEFNSDVFIDLLGYRKYGHNEGDEPRFTQPKLYKAISKHDSVRDIYVDQLKEEKIIDADYVKKLEEEYKEDLSNSLDDSKKDQKAFLTPILQEEWEGIGTADQDDMLEDIDTSFDLDKLSDTAEKMTNIPEDKNFMRKVAKLIKARHKMYFEDDQLDWAMGELLAYGTLMQEGHNVRLTGQDSERGTFSHRHGVLKVEASEEEYVPLNQIDAKGKLQLYNSSLSEYGVMGYEYGYAMASPKTLNIWEAQFGDFSNGAQIIIDQYISSAEDKWKVQNALVLLLPHGYEGQGSEHSSARMERYLQLCARDNMYVANVTTPANFFHLLRRQQKANFRKPLIVFTPKSLLRHPKVISTKEDLANGKFQPIIDDDDATFKNSKAVVLCQGKFYYDLLEEKEKRGIKEIAIIRLEQLFPLPIDQMNELIGKYKNADEVIWAQEEPRNMGAYTNLLLHYPKAKDFRVCSRDFYGSPAAGSVSLFKKRHQAVIDDVFKNFKSKNDSK
jgi:2-oxoglutarate dehydrogenase E1 component